MGDVACNVVFALTSGLVTYFYTNVMSVSAGLVGMIMLLSRFFDGFSDLAIGVIMDKVHSKHGRGRAWVLWMTIPYGVTAVALFCLAAASDRYCAGAVHFRHLQPVHHGCLHRAQPTVCDDGTAYDAR